MALTIENRRRLEKRSTIAGEKPTIPASNDHTDGSWIATDIYEGEYFLNIPDGLVYTREGNTIIEVNLPEGIIQNPYFPFTNPVVNGSDALNFNVNSFTFRINSRYFEHPSTADEITIGEGDPTLPRLDLVYINENNVATVQTGTPSADVTLTPAEMPISANGRVIGFKLAYIYVPPAHTAGSTPLTPISIDRWENQDKVIPDWTTGIPYVAGMFVLESRVMYRCIASHVSSALFASDSSNWEEISFADGNGIYANGGTISSNNISVIQDTITFQDLGGDDLLKLNQSTSDVAIGDVGAPATLTLIDSSQIKLQNTTHNNFLQTLDANVRWSLNLSTFALTNNYANASINFGATGTNGQVVFEATDKVYLSSTLAEYTGINVDVADIDAAGLKVLVSKEWVNAKLAANNELSEILANGNTSGANNIVMSANQDIVFASGAFFGYTGVAALTSDRTWELPDASGTIALLSDIAANNELSEILANGNITGGSNIVTSNDDFIAAANGGGELDLRYNSTDGVIFLGNNRASWNEVLYLSDGYIELSSYGNASSTIEFYTDNNDLVISEANNSLVWSGNGSGMTIDATKFTVGTSGMAGFTQLATAATVLGRTSFITANNTAATLETDAIDQYGSIVSSRNSTVNTGVTNTVVLGGKDIAGKTDDTAYVNQIGFTRSLLENSPSGFEVIMQSPLATADRLINVPDASGTLALLSDIPAELDGIYSGNGTVPSGTIATLTGNITFDGGQFNIIGANNLNTSYNLWTENDSGNSLAYISNSGTWQLGVADTAASRSDFLLSGTQGLIKLIPSNGSLDISNATADGVTPNTTADNQELRWTTRDSLGNMAEMNDIWLRNRDVTGGLVREVDNITDNGAYGISQTYLNVPTTGGTGTGLTVDVTTDGAGNILTVTPNAFGSEYRQNQLITVDGTLIGGAATPANDLTFQTNIVTLPYGVMVINNAIQTETIGGISDSTYNYGSRTLISTGNRHTLGAALGVLHVENRHLSSSNTTMLVDAFEQNTQLGFAVRSGSVGTSADTWNWRLKNNHEFTHNFGQLPTGDFIMRSDSRPNLFHMDASADSVQINSATTNASRFYVYENGDYPIAGRFTQAATGSATVVSAVAAATTGVNSGYNIAFNGDARNSTGQSGFRNYAFYGSNGHLWLANTDQRILVGNNAGANLFLKHETQMQSNTFVSGTGANAVYRDRVGQRISLQGGVINQDDTAAPFNSSYANTIVGYQFTTPSSAGGGLGWVVGFDTSISGGVVGGDLGANLINYSARVNPIYDTNGGDGDSYGFKYQSIRSNGTVGTVGTNSGNHWGAYIEHNFNALYNEQTGNTHGVEVNFSSNGLTGQVFSNLIGFKVSNALDAGTTVSTFTGLDVDVTNTTGATTYAALFNGGVVGIGTTTPVSQLTVAGDVEVGSADAYYLGDPTTDGTWRIIRSGDDLLMQQREAGTYNTKQTVSGA